MGGYASSLFANFWALSPEFRREFGHGEKSRFLERYGYQKILVSEDRRRKRYGAVSDRVTNVRRIGEAPGVLPSFLMQHLLPTAILVHKEDLDVELPPLVETPRPIAAGSDDPRDRELLAEYRRLESELLARIRADRHTAEDGKLLGALVELPSYLDRATEDCGTFEIRYPEASGGARIAAGRSFPRDWTTPKERWLLRTLEERLRAGDRVLVFLRHTGTAALPKRLLRRIGSRVTRKCLWLDTKKVPTARREAWIDEKVTAAGIRVLLVNPNAVKTGLNNLVGFNVAIWHELDYSAQTYRQANGRLHRIGQERPVAIHLPYYRGTAQQVAFELVARKVSASLQVDGVDIQAALEAAGAGMDDGLEAAMAIGEAVYRRLTVGV